MIYLLMVASWRSDWRGTIVGWHGYKSDGVTFRFQSYISRDKIYTDWKLGKNTVGIVPCFSHDRRVSIEQNALVRHSPSLFLSLSGSWAPFACKVVRMIHIIKWDFDIGNVEKAWRKFKYSNDKISLNEWRRFFALRGLDCNFSKQKQYSSIRTLFLVYF